MIGVLELLPPLLAQQQPPPNAPEFGGSSPIGLVVLPAAAMRARASAICACVGTWTT